MLCQLLRPSHASGFIRSTAQLETKLRQNACVRGAINIDSQWVRNFSKLVGCCVMRSRRAVGCMKQLPASSSVHLFGCVVSSRSAQVETKLQLYVWVCKANSVNPGLQIRTQDVSSDGILHGKPVFIQHGSYLVQ